MYGQGFLAQSLSSKTIARQQNGICIPPSSALISRVTVLYFNGVYRPFTPRNQRRIINASESPEISGELSDYASVRLVLLRGVAIGTVGVERALKRGLVMTTNKRITDLTDYTSVLPYASELFGVYQPMIG